jgi:hypothetical protein
MLEKHDCHDCGARPSRLHQVGCDTEQCPKCGSQRISCGCGAWKMKRIPWSGVFPGTVEAIEYGWFVKWIPDVVGTYAPGRWVPCVKSDPHAEPDLNRVVRECVWDRKKQRFVRRQP